MTKASEKKILVVDDEPDVRNFLAACIEDAGFKVDTAADGVEALDKIKADLPDLMTLDMVMPRKLGITLIRELRQHETYAHLPIIVITAHAHDELGSEDIKILNAFTSGLRPRYTMEKPVTPERLVKAIAEILKVEVKKSEPVSSPASDRQTIINLLNGTNAETLKKIRSILTERG